MKKILLFLIVLVNLLACSSNEALDSNNHQLNANFVESLNNFNNSYKNLIGTHWEENYDSQVKCDKCWGWLKNTLIVASADIIGAGAGAIAVKEIAAGVGVATGGTGAAVVVGVAATIAGAGASLAAADQLDESNLIELPSEDDQLQDKISEDELIADLEITFPQEFENLSTIGADHNILVYQNYFENETKSEVLFTEKLSVEEKAVFETDEWEEKINEVNELILDYANTDDPLKLSASFLEKGLITPNIKLVLDKFYEIFLESQNSHDIKAIVQFYIDAIADEDTLSIDEKEALISSLSVATESPYFWSKIQQ